MFSLSKDYWSFLDRREFSNIILTSGLHHNLLFQTSLWKRWRYKTWLLKQYWLLKGGTRKQNIGKTSYGLDRSGIPVLGGRWRQQAQSILDDAEKRQEMRKAIWTCWIVLHWTSENLLSQRKSFIIWNCRLWKFNQLKPSFPDRTHSYHKA